jgi:molybdopterin converting factor small subunit
MPRVVFTPTLARHLDCPAREAEGETVRAVLERVFADNPRLRGYVLDDQGWLRRHVAVFVDARQIRDRDGLSDPVHPGGEVFVMQALSGG